MSLVRTWYTVEEAASKFGVEPAEILRWVDDGLVRAEQEAGGPLRINADDLELQVGEIPGP